VQIFQLPSYSSAAAARFGLRFSTSSLGLLFEVLRDRTRQPIPGLTVVRRESSGPEHRATIKWAGTFSDVSVSSFDEEVSGSVSGTVILGLSGPDRLFASPKANTGIGTFPEVSTPLPAPLYKVYFGVISSKKHAYYSVSSVRLSQMATFPGATASFSLSFKTTSPKLLDQVVGASRLGRDLTKVTVVIRESGLGKSSTATEWAGAFSEAAVTSFEENMAGPPGGRVTLSLR
jgi:hypothetical protein